ncbi:hypothetical protein GHT06_018996 [Daphnia sinensis]|uniref:Uncharacterized protein n=1 Tax=Daphnia sinensis TaxID=1820382 RepID=A0AAD5KJG0_9CRUS|nr:hypothetical protein GHT06_018996 [Daphnia sinensis]
MTFFGQIVVVPEKIPIDSTVLDCYNMINNKLCGINEMTPADGKYVFSQEPQSGGYWMRTVEWEILNCVLEQVQLIQPMADADFATPIGKASATAGVLSHNHLTLVWDTTYTHKIQHETRMIESGFGNLLAKTESEKHFRLIDNDRQLDFHLTLQPPCDHQQYCTNRTTSFKIASAAVETSAPSGDPEVDTLANKQYIQDRATDLVTPCGPQPKFNNYTINLDGWELVKYSPCYWTNGFVNFNDKPYAYRNNTWKKIDPNIVLPEHTGAHSFRYDDVKSFNYDHRSNPAYSDNLLNHMNVMADIVAAMNEHPPSDFSLNHRPDTTNVLLTAAVGNH